MKRLKALAAAAMNWWRNLPDKTVAVKVPLKLAVVLVGVLCVLALAMFSARRVEAVFVDAPVTQSQFAELDAKVSACVAPRVSKSKKR